MALVVKNSPVSAGDTRDDPRVGKITGVGGGNPSSILAWIIPLAKQPGRLQSRGSQSQTQPSTHIIAKCNWERDTGFLLCGTHRIWNEIWNWRRGQRVEERNMRPTEETESSSDGFLSSEFRWWMECLLRRTGKQEEIFLETLSWGLE